MDDSPSFKANQFANKAEQYVMKGDIANACTAHFRAAELFLLAMNDTKDPEAVKTLKLLYASHTRSGKDFQRRLNMPQPSQQISSSPPGNYILSREPSVESKVHRIKSTTRNVVETGPSESMIKGSRELFMGQDNNTITMGSDLGSVLLNENIYNNRSSTSNQRDPSLSISNSYMFLDSTDAPKGTPSGDEDPFNKFWEAVEGLVHKISGPVVGNPAPSGENSVGKKEPEYKAQGSFLSSYLLVKGSQELDTSGYQSQQDSGQSEYRYQTQPNRIQANSRIQQLETENLQLKRHVEVLVERIVELEKAQEENTMLRSSIIQFRQDIEKQRANNHSQLFASVPSGIVLASTLKGTRTLPTPGIGRSYMEMSVNPRASSNSEVLALEQTVAGLEIELQAAKETILNYQKKWDKLKDTVKKKRDKKDSSEASLNLETTALDQSVTFPSNPSNAVASPSSSSMYFSSILPD